MSAKTPQTKPAVIHQIKFTSELGQMTDKAPQEIFAELIITADDVCRFYCEISQGGFTHRHLRIVERSTSFIFRNVKYRAAIRQDYTMVARLRRVGSAWIGYADPAPSPRYGSFAVDFLINKKVSGMAPKWAQASRRGSLTEIPISSWFRRWVHSCANYMILKIRSWNTLLRLRF